MSLESWVEDLALHASLGTRASRVVSVIASQPRLASCATGREIAERAGVNIATVTRTAQSLGFTGWPDLQLELRGRYLGSLSAGDVLHEHADLAHTAADPILAAFRADASNLALAARTMDLDAARAIADAILGASQTLVLGSGSYLAPGVMLAQFAGYLGLNVEPDLMAGTYRASRLMGMSPGDALVVFNVWRLPHEILAATRFAKERGLVTCVITDRRASPLAEAGDHVVVIPSEGVAHFPSMTAAFALVHGLLNEIVTRDPRGARRTTAATEDSWRRLNLMADQPPPR